LNIKSLWNKAISTFKTEMVFAISLILALITSVISQPKLSYINFQVLILTFLCFVSSMFITNDVDLITFVPLTLIINKLSGEAIKILNIEYSVKN